MNRRIIWLTPFILIALLLLWFWRMDQSISSRLSRGWFLPPIDFYTGEQKLRIESAAPLSRITNAAKRLSWRAREPKQDGRQAYSRQRQKDAQRKDRQHSAARQQGPRHDRIRPGSRARGAGPREGLERELRAAQGG